MTNHEHRRDRWPIRRLQDYLQILTILSLIGGGTVVAVTVIRKHSRWMDAVERIGAFQNEEVKVWHPKTLEIERRTEMLEVKMDLMLKKIDRIELKLDRRALRGADLIKRTVG